MLYNHVRPRAWIRQVSKADFMTGFQSKHILWTYIIAVSIGANKGGLYKIIIICFIYKIEGIAVIGAARFRHHVVAYVMRERMWVNFVGSSGYWTKPRLCCKPFAELPPLHFRALTGWSSVVAVGEDR